MCKNFGKVSSILRDRKFSNHLGGGSSQTAAHSWNCANSDSCFEAKVEGSELVGKFLEPSRNLGHPFEHLGHVQRVLFPHLHVWVVQGNVLGTLKISALQTSPSRVYFPGDVGEDTRSSGLICLSLPRRWNTRRGWNAQPCPPVCNYFLIWKLPLKRNWNCCTLRCKAKAGIGFQRGKKKKEQELYKRL